MVIKHKIPCNGWDAVICVNEQGKVLVLKWRNSLPYNGNKIIEDLHEDDNIPGVNYNGLEKKAGIYYASLVLNIHCCNIDSAGWRLLNRALSFTFA